MTLSTLKNYQNNPKLAALAHHVIDQMLYNQADQEIPAEIWLEFNEAFHAEYGIFPPDDVFGKLQRLDAVQQEMAITPVLRRMIDPNAKDLRTEQVVALANRFGIRVELYVSEEALRAELSKEISGSAEEVLTPRQERLLAGRVSDILRVKDKNKKDPRHPDQDRLQKEIQNNCFTTLRLYQRTKERLEYAVADEIENAVQLRLAAERAAAYTAERQKLVYEHSNAFREQFAAFLAGDGSTYYLVEQGERASLRTASRDPIQMMKGFVEQAQTSFDNLFSFAGGKDNTLFNFFKMLAKTLMNFFAGILNAVPLLKGLDKIIPAFGRDKNAPIGEDEIEDSADPERAASFTQQVAILSNQGRKWKTKAAEYNERWREQPDTLADWLELIRDLAESGATKQADECLRNQEQYYIAQLEALEADRYTGPVPKDANLQAVLTGYRAVLADMEHVELEQADEAYLEQNFEARLAAFSVFAEQAETILAASRKMETDYGHNSRYQQEDAQLTRGVAASQNGARPEYTSKLQARLAHVQRELAATATALQASGQSVSTQKRDLARSTVPEFTAIVDTQAITPARRAAQTKLAEVRQLRQQEAARLAAEEQQRRQRLGMSSTTPVDV